MLKTLLVCLFAVATLSRASHPVGRSGRSQLLFGIVTDHYVRLHEMTLHRLGGVIRLKNYCRNPLRGELVVANNGLHDRDPYIAGTDLDLTITCTPVGPFANCGYPISVNITQFC